MCTRLKNRKKRPLRSRLKKLTKDLEMTKEKAVTPFPVTNPEIKEKEGELGSFSFSYVY